MRPDKTTRILGSSRSSAAKSAAGSPLKNQRGMTLIEIMIVIAIIAGLMAVLGTSANTYLQRSRVENAKIQMREIGKQLEAYNLTCNQYPTTDQGLAALVSNPGDCSNWGPEPYIRKEPKDPWGKPFLYESDGATYAIRSLGRDRKEGGDGYDKDLSTEELD
jgi:general secretion pathway protein G